jgi:hypothetical protein
MQPNKECLDEPMSKTPPEKKSIQDILNDLQAQQQGLDALQPSGIMGVSTPGYTTWSASTLSIRAQLTDSEKLELSHLKAEREQATKHLRLAKFKELHVDYRQGLISILESDVFVSLLKESKAPISQREQELENRGNGGGLFAHSSFSYGAFYAGITPLMQSLNEMDITLDDLKRTHAEQVLEDTLVVP